MPTQLVYLMILTMSVYLLTKENFQIEKLPDHGTLPTLIKRQQLLAVAILCSFKLLHLFLKSILILRWNIRMSRWNRMGWNCDFRPLSVRIE